MKMELYAVQIFVDDWDKACKFYEETLGLTCEFKDEGFGWAEFDVGGAKFGIERCDRASHPQADLIGRFVGASLKVNDAFETYEILKSKGVEFTEPPEKQDWGGVLAYFKDTSENVLTLMSETKD